MTLVCRDIPDLASAYLDGDLPLRPRLGVGMHLALCRHCRTYVGSLKVTRRLVAESLRADVPPALKQALDLTDRDPGTLSEERR